MYVVWESVPRRAFTDTRRWLLGSFVAWIIVTLVVGMITAIFAPSIDSIIDRALLGFAGAVIAVIVIFSITYLVHLLLAPVRQRNELRRQIEEQQKPNEKLIIREQLAEFYIEGIKLQSLCYNLSVSVPVKQIDEWTEKVTNYLDKYLGKDYKTTFLDISTTTSPLLPAPSRERNVIYLFLNSCLAHLQEFIKGMRE